MSPELRRYLDLERAMIALDEVGDPRADTLRDAMDPLWYALLEEEQAWLNHRHDAPLHGPRSITLTVGHAIYVAPVEVQFCAIPDKPLTGWHEAA